MIDREVIGVERGVQQILALRWDLSESAISRYLNGQYSDRNPNLELIMQVRQDARNAVNGKAFYVVRDKDNQLHAFLHIPRRDRTTGRWFNPMDRLTKVETFRPLFPEYFLPEGVNLDFESRPLKILVKVLPQ